MAAAAQRVRRAALRLHAVRSGRKVLRAALHTWRAAITGPEERKEALRMCIRRKRVAFQQFKQWYWDSFGTDVQDTIRRMFHSTDAAVTSPLPTRRSQPSPMLYGRPAPTHYPTSTYDYPPSDSSSGPYNDDGGQYDNSSASFAPYYPPNPRRVDHEGPHLAYPSSLHQPAGARPDRRHTSDTVSPSKAVSNLPAAAAQQPTSRPRPSAPRLSRDSARSPLGWQHAAHTNSQAAAAADAAPPSRHAGLEELARRSPLMWHSTDHSAGAGAGMAPASGVSPHPAAPARAWGDGGALPLASDLAASPAPWSTYPLSPPLSLGAAAATAAALAQASSAPSPPRHSQPRLPDPRFIPSPSGETPSASASASPDVLVHPRLVPHRQQYSQLFDKQQYNELYDMQSDEQPHLGGVPPPWPTHVAHVVSRPERPINGAAGVLPDPAVAAHHHHAPAFQSWRARASEVVSPLGLAGGVGSSLERLNDAPWGVRAASAISLAGGEYGVMGAAPLPSVPEPSPRAGAPLMRGMGADPAVGAGSGIAADGGYAVGQLPAGQVRPATAVQISWRHVTNNDLFDAFDGGAPDLPAWV